jgi:beta-mannanase
VNSHLDKWYPGGKYADWIGLSYFDQPESMMEPVINFARSNHKPVMIAEGTPKGIGSCGGQKSWDSWYDNFLKFVDKNGIKAISYINCAWDRQVMWKGQDWRDARVEDNDLVLKNWTAEMKKDKYLKYSPGLFAVTGETK